MLDFRDTDAAIEITTLSNGVRVVTDRMTSIASASVGVFVGAGARHESEELNGVAHFLEHMAFKGTTTRSALKIAEEIEDVGGELNAYTSRETTVYYARVLADDAPLALELIADIVRNATMPEEDIEVERGVIIQEIGQSADTPDDVIFDWAQARAFPDQPIGRPILGPLENVQRFGRGDFTGFISSRYTADQMVVAAAGLVEHAEVVALAEKLFGDVPAGSDAAAAPARYVGGDIRVEKDLEQAHVILGFEAPSYKSPEFYASQIAATVLCGGMSSRLFQEIREKRGLCYAIFAQPSHYSDGGWTSIYAGCGGPQIRELLDSSVDELKRAAGSVRSDEVARAKAQIRASVLMGLESPASRCQRVARGLLAHGRIRQIAEVMEKIEAVTPEDVARSVAAQFSKPPTLAMYGPIAGAPGYDELCSRLSA